MKMYLVSLGAGLIVGIFYCMTGVKSPAPPLVALIGLLGMVIGEQLPRIAMQWMSSIF